MRYYRPKKKELVEGLELEMFYAPESSWNKFTYIPNSHRGIPLEDLRIKYLDSGDFNSIGVAVKKVFLGTQTQIKGFDDQNNEITEEVDVFSQEVMTLWKTGKPIGFFYPYKPLLNVRIEEKEYTVKNITELKKIMNESKN